MAKKTVELIKVEDDHDGSELPEDTQPVWLAFEDKAWSLYLSDQNLKTLRDFIAGFTKSASPVQSKGQAPKTRKSNVETFGLDPVAVREWGITQGLAKKQGRLSAEVYKKYKDAH